MMHCSVFAVVQGYKQGTLYGENKTLRYTFLCSFAKIQIGNDILILRTYDFVLIQFGRKIQC